MSSSNLNVRNATVVFADSSDEDGSDKHKKDDKTLRKYEESGTSATYKNMYVKCKICSHLSTSYSFSSTDSSSDSEFSIQHKPKKTFTIDKDNFNDKALKKKNNEPVFENISEETSYAETTTKAECNKQENRKSETVNVKSCERKINDCKAIAGEVLTSRGDEKGQSEIKASTPESQFYHNIDPLIRVKLPIYGRKKKKLFILKLSQLLAMVKKRNHPLYLLADSLTMENVKYLSENNIELLMRILSEFVCVRAVAQKMKMR